MKYKEKQQMELVEQIRYLLESDPDREWTASQIGDILGYRGMRGKLVAAALSSMARAGEATKGAARGAYRFAIGDDFLQGRLEMVRSGTGFVTDLEKGRTLRIAPGDRGGAMPGDVVLVRPVKIGHDAESGRIVKIVSRSEKLVCGTLYSTGAGRFVTPLDPSYPRDFAVDGEVAAPDGDRVVVKITARDGTADYPRCEIVDVIGPADNPSLDTEAVCREYELPGPFGEDVLREASDAASWLADPGDRLDLRKAFILTIDPADSRDFDDALSFKALKDGGCELGVHIADVSHFVRPGTALDAEAARRGNSVYLADKVIPMLPEQLSNGVCSLRPHEDRLCFSVFISFDRDGVPGRRSFAKSVIRSKLRLNYGQALAIIEGRQPEGLGRVPKAAVELLTGATELALKLRKARMALGALDLDLPECRPLIDKDGRITGFSVEEYDVSHQLIEECMVAANEAVATELASHGVRIVSRLHEPPDEAKIADLAASLRAVGFKPGDISKPVNLSRFIASVADSPLRTQVHTMILRSMKRAVYSADASGHFGLAKSRYSHFTSPIRRYPDLVLHRQLAEYLARRSARTFSLQYLKAVAGKCTETESRADEAERTLLEIKKYRFLQQQIDDGEVETYDAVVGKVTKFGIFVDLPMLAVGGLVHVSTISPNFARFNSFDETLSVDGVRYKVGDAVKVAVSHVDFNARKLDFTLVSGNHWKGRAKGRRAGKRAKFFA